MFLWWILQASLIATQPVSRINHDIKCVMGLLAHALGQDLSLFFIIISSLFLAQVLFTYWQHKSKWSFQVGEGELAFLSNNIFAEFSTGNFYYHLCLQLQLSNYLLISSTRSTKKIEPLCLIIPACHSSGACFHSSLHVVHSRLLVLYLYVWHSRLLELNHITKSTPLMALFLPYLQFIHVLLPSESSYIICTVAYVSAN